MNANRKVVLIIILGVGACIFSFLLSQYYSSKYHRNQLLLSRIQQISGSVDHIQLLGKGFIQNGDEASWRRINEIIEAVDRQLDNATQTRTRWRQEMMELEASLAGYHQILDRIHDPAVRLRAEKETLQGIGISFSKEIEETIVRPYREEEGLRIYQGAAIDPFKTRIKDTAYDLIDLHLRLQLILLELLLDWDLKSYQSKKLEISKAMERHNAQLQYMNVLMGNEPRINDIIDSLGRKLTSLVNHEQVIVENFTTLKALNESLGAAGEKLLTASHALSATIVADTSRANQFNRFINWGLLIGILSGLGFLGAKLAGDIIRFVEDLKKSRESLQSNEKNLEVTLNAIGDGVIATDDKGVITRMNPAAERLTGWSASDAVGRHLPEVFRIVNAQTRQQVANPADKVLAEGIIVGLANHSVLISKDGAERQIADSGAPIRDSQGNILGVVLVFRDVTETYHQEQKLRESEKRLKDITANVPGVVYQFQSMPDQVFAYSFVSEKALEIFGLDPKPATFFSRFNDCIHDEDKERFNASIREAIHKVIPWHFEGRFVKPSGETLWFSGHSIPRQAGETLFFYGVLMDITARRRMEESLRLTQFCFEKAPIGIFRISAQAQILEVNEQACRNLGYTSAELCGMTVFDIDPTFNPSLWPDHINKLRESKTRNIESWHKHKNGKVFPVEILINIMGFGGNEFHLAYVQDISERKQWESDLESSERRFKELFNEAPVMYVITENRQGEPYIVDANNLFIATLGYSRPEILGSPLANYYTPDSCRHLLDQGGYQRALNGQFMAEERDFVARDGRVVHTLLHALPEHRTDGRVAGTRAMFLDISARKKAEQEAKRLEAALMQAQKMEAIGTLAGGIAHDFNNILSAVVGYAQLSLKDTDKNSRLHYNLTQIFTAGMRASDLVRQILTFSRQAERERKPLQIAPLIKEALKLLRSSLPATIEIVQQIPEEMETIMADPTQVHQIVMNLCTNAAQSMEEAGGRMTVTLAKVSLTVAEIKLYPGLEPGDFIKLSVQDTGKGIAPEIMEMIFDPYFTTKTEGKGTGLGLSVVHGIVKSYGGGIYVQSRLNLGTTFDVYIPAVKLQPLLERRENLRLPTGSETILLVDDEPVLVDVGQQTLQMLGYTVLICNNGQTALELFNQAPRQIDLVISDMTMPKMTGDILAARLLDIRPDLPIIICTGFSSKLTDKQAADLGVKALVEKPLVAEKLAFVVRKVLDEAVEKKESRQTN